MAWSSWCFCLLPCRSEDPFCVFLCFSSLVGIGISFYILSWLGVCRSDCALFEWVGFDCPANLVRLPLKAVVTFLTSLYGLWSLYFVRGTASNTRDEFKAPTSQKKTYFGRNLVISLSRINCLVNTGKVSFWSIQYLNELLNVLLRTIRTFKCTSGPSCLEHAELTTTQTYRF